MLFLRRKHQLRKQKPGYVIALVLVFVLLLLPAIYTLLTRISSAEANITPIANWKFDEGYGTTTQESMHNQNTGTLLGDVSWQTEDQCIAGKCLYFNGTSAEVIIEGTIDFKSISMWVRPNSVSSGALADFGNDVRITVSSGVVSATGFSTPTIYIDGQVSNNLEANKWQHIAITSSETIHGNSIHFGNYSDTFIRGFIDEIRMYTDEQPAKAIKSDYIARDSLRGVSAQMGKPDTNPLSHGLVGYWKFDETAGNAHDSSGNGTTLSNNGSAYAPAKFGNGSTFDGSNDSFAANDSDNDDDALSLTDSVTLAAWINTDDVSGTQHIMGKWNDEQHSYRLTLENGELRMYLGSKNAYQTTTASNIEPHSFVHVAGVYQASSQTVRLYINGKLAQSTTTGTLPDSLEQTAATFTVGSTGASEHFTGLIDEARVYNRALPEGEITSLFQYAPGPIGYWKMDESSWNNNCSSASIFDSSGNGHNAHACPASTGPNTTDTGMFGKAGVFDGDDDYVNVGQPAKLDLGLPASSYTYSAWINLSSSTSGTVETIFAKGQSGYESGEVTFSMSIEHPTDGSDRFIQCQISDGTHTVTTGGSKNAEAALDLNTWYHVSCVRDSEDDEQRLYINGSLVQSEMDTTTGSIQTDADIVIGCNSGDKNGCLHGRIDEVKLYNYARNEGHVVEDMNAAHPLGGSPIGSQAVYWRFDEGYGTTANSALNGGTNGTLTSMASPPTSTSGWTSNGRLNKALAFDGTDDKVVIAVASDANVDFNGSEPFSLSTWMYMTNAPGSSDQDCLMCKWDATTPARAYRLYVANDDSDNTAHIVGQVFDESTDQSISASTLADGIETNTWYHITMTFNGSTNGAADSLIIYIDGQRKASNSANGSFAGLEDVSADFTIGDYDATDVTSADTAFSGILDEPQVFSDDLTIDEVRVIMNFNGAVAAAYSQTSSNEAAQTIDGAGNPPVGYFSFDENDGTTVIDRSGNENNGTFVGATQWARGKWGAGVYTDGSISANGDTFIRLPDNIYDTIGNGTVCFWINPSDVGNDLQTVFNVAEDDNNNGSNYIDMHYYTPDNTMVLEIVDNGSTAALAAAPSNSITPQTWNHVCMYGGNSGNGIYINGVRQSLTYVMGSASATAWFDDVSENTTGYVIACTDSDASDNNDCALTTHMYVGYIDEVKIYDYVRTDAQVAYEFDRGGPIGWWKFDECTGSTLNNSGSAGSTLNATITIGGSGSNTSTGSCGSGTGTQAWNNGTTGKFNGSLDFDNTDDYATVADNPILDFVDGHDMSISAWFYRDGNSDQDTILSKTTNCTSNTRTGYCLWIGTSGDIHFKIGDGNTNDTFELQSTTNITSPGWHHVVVVWDDDSATNTTMYIDGLDNAPSKTGTIGNIGDTSNTSNLSIGSQATTTHPFNGKLDDIRLFRFALSPMQVKKLFNDNANMRFGPKEGSP